MAFRCQRWNSLPRAGGILDQPIKLMERIDTALYTYRAIKLAREAKNKVEFSEAYPHYMEWLGYIEQLRTETGS